MELVGQREEPAVARPVGMVVAALAAYALFRWMLGSFQLPAQTPAWALAAAALVTAFGGIGLPIAGITALVRFFRDGRGNVLLLALFGVLAWAAFWLALPWIPRGFQPLAATIRDLGIILAAAGAGIALAGKVKEPNILLPAALFAAFADFVVVNYGTVKHALSTEKGTAVLMAVTAKLPAVHAALTPLAIGPADFMFLGIFLACAARFDMDVALTAKVLTLVLGVCLFLLLLPIPVLGSVPALIPMAVGFIVPNWRRFRLTREEIISTAVALVLIGGLFLAYFLYAFPGKK